MKNSREISVDIVNKVLTNNSYSNIVLNKELKKYNLSDKDRALVTEIVYGTIKYKYTIDKILNTFVKKGIKSLDAYVADILRVSIYQIRFLDKIPSFAAVNEGVELAKRKKSIGASKLVNGVLRNYLRNSKKVYYNEKNAVEKLCFEYSFDKWLVNMFINQYGIKLTQSILKGLNERPCVTVRVNNLKGTYDDVYSKLENQGYDIEKGYASLESIRINKGKSIENNLSFIEGLITVQDESAMLIAPSMDLDENSNVLDLCSAPGGKTTHISEIMNNKGTVKAFDIHKNKLSLVKENAKRLGVENIKCEKMDARVYDKDLENTANAVLIDVPCSGIGIIRKKPEIKYTKNLKSLKELIPIQRSIMMNASKYVKAKGVLLYSTCTLNKKENEDNIEWFLNNNSEYTVEKLYYGDLDNFIYHEKGYVTILPNTYMDGFFICKLRKLR